MQGHAQGQGQLDWPRAWKENDVAQGPLPEIPLAGVRQIARWVGLDSATKAKFVERPRYSAEGGIGAHSSRIQCALGGLHSAKAVEGGVPARPKPPRAPPSASAPASPWAMVPAGPGTPPSTALNCLSPPQWAGSRCATPPKRIGFGNGRPRYPLPRCSGAVPRSAKHETARKMGEPTRTRTPRPLRQTTSTWRHLPRATGLSS